MKTRLFFLLFIAFYCMTINAQTNVSGTLTSSTTWTISGSPYNVTGNFGVPIGITLTIEPGVIVNFNSTFQIIIQGNLLANGINGNPITFNGYVAGSAMILFQKTNLSNSSFSYINMNGPKDGIKLSNNNNDNNSGILTITNLKLINSKIETNGQNSTAIIEIHNSILTNSKTYGDYPESEIIKLNNCNISGGEIISFAYNNGIFLNNDTVTGTYFASGCCGSNVNIYLSKIINCNFNQANDSQPESGNYLNIDRSQINDSRINMPVGTVNINKSNFLYSTVYSNSYCVISGNGIIDSSSFIGNGGLTAIERGPVGSGYPYDNNNLYKFTNCTFIAFGTDIKINASTNSAFGNGQVSIQYCDFLDTPPHFIVINNSPHDATANYNWWGTTVTSEIDNSIYDFWDDMVDGKVIYTNYLTGPINLITNNNEELISSNYISIYPNPFSVESILKSSENLENATLTLYNLQGQKIKIINNISGNEIKLQRENLASGIYFIRLSQFDKVFTTDKLIISD